MDNTYKIVLLAFIAVLATSTASATVVVDSAYWQDTFSMSMYAARNDQTPFLVTHTDASGVQQVLPYQDDIGVMRGEEPMASNIDSQLEAMGFDIGEVVDHENPNLDLRPDDLDHVYITDIGQPQAAVVSAPVAQETGSWIFIADSDNVNDIIDIVEDENLDVTLVGEFNTHRLELLEEISDSHIEGDNHFELSVEMAEEFNDHVSFSRATVTDGNFLERDMFDGEYPVLIAGANILPDETKNYIQRANLNSVVMLGNHMTDVGQEIQDETDATVLVKYGQARGGEATAEALSFYPLPGADAELKINSVEYSPGQQQLLVEYENPSGVNLYTSSSIDIGYDETVETVVDDEPVFVGTESTVIESYDVELDVGQVEYYEAAMTTRFGPSEKQLDEYVTPEDDHTPPYYIDIELSEIEDNANLTLLDAYYSTDVSRFAVEIENSGENDVYVSATVHEFLEGGNTETRTSDVREIEAGEEGTVYIPAELDEIDLEDNEDLNIELRFGENEVVLVQNEEHELEFKTAGGIVSTITGGITGNAGSIGMALLFIIVGIAAYYFITQRESQEQSQGYSYGGYSY